MTLTALTQQIHARTAAAITEARDQLAHGWTDHEVLVVAVDAWAVIVDLKDQVAARHELAGHACVRCTTPITGAPVLDPDQVAWLGQNADRWCSAACHDADAEDYWTTRWAVPA